MTRAKLYYIIEHGEDGGPWGIVYDTIMLLAITASIIPLMFVENHPAFHIIELVTVTLFIIDYILRWMTEDYRSGKGKKAFAIYPITFWAIIDLLSILPAMRDRKSVV